MDFLIKNTKGLTLKTKGKYCTEDLVIEIDPSLVEGYMEVDELPEVGLPRVLYKVMLEEPEYYIWENEEWLQLNTKGGGGIIEVDELPTTNIDSNVLYKTPRKFTDMYIYYAGYVNGSLSETYEITGCEEVETKPTSNIVESDLLNGKFYLYYVKDENDIFVYGNMGYGAMWISASLLLEQSGLAGLTFKGEFEDYGVPLSNGYYAYFENEKYYKTIDSELKEVNDSNYMLSKFFNNQRIDKLEYIDNASEYIESERFYKKNIEHIKITFSKGVSISYPTYPYFFKIYNDSFLSNYIKTIHLIHIDRTASIEIASGAFLGGGEATQTTPKCNLENLVIDFGTIHPINNESAYHTLENWLDGSPIANGNGYIYVPDDLVDTVKALDGWSTYASQIKPLSEYVEE